MSARLGDAVLAGLLGLLGALPHGPHQQAERDRTGVHQPDEGIASTNAGVGSSAVQSSRIGVRCSAVTPATARHEHRSATVNNPWKVTPNAVDDSTPSTISPTATSTGRRRSSSNARQATSPIARSSGSRNSGGVLPGSCMVVTSVTTPSAAPTATATTSVYAGSSEYVHKNRRTECNECIR
ncbi:MAG TPA: hypothetical protein VGD67_18700 [Pseudonocardiaceae bacterium]